MNKKFSLIKLIRVILCILIMALLVVSIGARIYFRSGLGDYYKASKKTFVIPDLQKGFIPQGIAYDARTNSFLVCGHCLEGASPIYIVSTDDNTCRRVELANNDGSSFEKHSGGIAIHNDYIYIAGCDDASLYAFDYNAIINSSDGDEVRCDGAVVLKNGDDYLNADCLYAADDGIYVSEFYRNPNYMTASSHEVNTSGGDINHAFIVKFPYDNGIASSFGVLTKPELAISNPDLTQGICLLGDKMFLSESYGADKSRIEVYDLNAADNGKSTTILGEEVKLLEFDSNSRIHEKSLPAMAEEIEIVGGRLYTMNESASNKYIFGKFISAEYCYATDLNYIMSE